METLKKNLPLIIVILVSLLPLNPLLKRGFFPMHDDTQPARVYEMAQSLKDGQFPVRWVNDLGYGYGYPIFNFYSPLPYYIGAFGVLSGWDVLAATKLMFGLGLVLAGITMYFLGQYIWGKWGGVVSALLYTYAPYHAVQLYVRGAVGELWAYGFLPLVLLGIIWGKSDLKKGLVIGSLGVSGVFLSHNISALILIYLIGLWLLIELVKVGLSKRSGYFTPVILITLLGFGLSAFFALPAFFEANYTQVDQLRQGSNDYHTHFVSLDQLWDSTWGFGGSAAGRADGMSFKIGKLHLILAGLALLVSVGNKKLFKNSRDVIVLLMAGFAVSVFLMLAISAKFWDNLPFFDFIQYPWRFLTFAIFFISIWADSLTRWPFDRTFKMILGTVISVVIIALNLKYFQPQFINDKTAQSYVSESALKWDISKISDEYLPKSFSIPKTPGEIAVTKMSTNDAIIMRSQDQVSHRISLNISALEKAEMVFNIADFPGWQFVSDGSKVNPVVKNGRPVLTVDPGNHVMTAYFADTPIRLVGNIVSLVSAAVFLTIILRIRYEKQKN